MIWKIDSILSRLNEGYLHLQREGFSSTLKAVLRQLNASYEGYYYYLNYKFKRYRGIQTVNESVLFRTLWADPEDIVHLPTRSFDKWSNIGEVRGGNWDKPKGKFENQSIAPGLKERFEKGTKWENIEYVSEALEKVQTGRSTWNGCHTPDDVKKRCNKIDELYVKLQTEGFQSQVELHDTDPKSLLLCGSFDRSQTDIAVHVGRDGDLLFVDGRHRLMIAKILGVKKVPIRVVIRHKQWQKFREQIKDTNNPRSIEGWSEKFRHHPDLQDLLPSNPDFQ